MPFHEFFRRITIEIFSFLERVDSGYFRYPVVIGEHLLGSVKSRAHESVAFQWPRRHSWLRSGNTVGAHDSMAFRAAGGWNWLRYYNVLGSASLSYCRIWCWDANGWC